MIAWVEGAFLSIAFLAMVFLYFHHMIDGLEAAGDDGGACG